MHSIPLALDILLTPSLWGKFVGVCVACLLLILGPLVAIDSYFYGRLVIAPLNIVLYNVLSEHTSSELYGMLSCCDPLTCVFV